MRNLFSIVLLLLLTLACTSTSLFSTPVPLPTNTPFPSPTTESVTNSSEWTLAYAHDKDGNPLEGDINVLINAVKNGQDVKIIMNDNQDEYYSTEAENLWVKKGIVYAQNTSSVSVEFQGKILRFQEDSYYWMVIVSTIGNRDMIRWSVGEHTPQGHDSDKVAMKWFIR